MRGHAADHCHRDAASIAEINGTTLFDSIFETAGAGATVDLADQTGGLTVNIVTVEGPPQNLGAWTELIFNGSDAATNQTNEWNGVQYVGMETTLQTIANHGIVDVPVDQATAAPPTAHREMVTELGWYKGIGTPIKFSRTQGGTRRPPPKFAEHGSEVLAQHGYTEAEVEALAEAGVLHLQRRL